MNEATDLLSVRLAHQKLLALFPDGCFCVDNRSTSAFVPGRNNEIISRLTILNDCNPRDEKHREEMMKMYTMPTKCRYSSRKTSQLPDVLLFHPIPTPRPRRLAISWSLFHALPLLFYN